MSDAPKSSSGAEHPKDHPAKKPKKRRGRGNPANLRPPWKKGQSGNPKGRPKGRTLTDRLLKRLEQEGGEIADLLVDAWIREAKRGRFPQLKEILDRTEGKVAEKRELTGADGGPIEVDDATNRVLGKLAAQLEEEGSDPSEPDES
tara:strand:- start:430 stop:867 length:438 start_codon:yes stop_codon:yes gene_type:complete